MSIDFDALLSQLGLDDTNKNTHSPPSHKTTNNTTQIKTPDSSAKKVQMVLNINLTPQHIEQLMIYDNEDPVLKVNEFCTKHSLPANAKKVILTQIYNTQNQSFNNEPQQLTPTQFTPMKQYKKVSKPAQQPGERLYKVGMMKKQIRENQIKEYQREEYISRQQQQQNKPILSQNSNIIAKRMGYTNGYMRDKKLITSPEIFEQDDECTFQPRINEMSRQLNQFTKQQQQQHDNIFEDLYARARYKQYSSGNTESENPECTFQPFVQSFSQYTNLQSEDFLTRMQKNMEYQKEKMEIIRLKYENTDLRTQQLLFRPKVGRGPKKNNEQNVEPIFEQLYKQSFQQQARIRELKDIHLKEEQVRNLQSNFNELSQDLVFEQRRRILNELFNQMDNNHDGFVGCSREEIQQIHPKAVAILWPALQSISEMNNQIDFEDFFEITLGYCLTLPQSDKDALFLKLFQKNTQQEQFSFTPMIDKKSEQICRKQCNYLQCRCEVCVANVQIQVRLNEQEQQ